MLSEFNNKQQRSSGNYLVDDHIPSAALKNKTSGLELYKDANNKWVLAKSKPINGGKWFIISEIGLIEAYKPLINRILWITICLVVGSFL